MEFGAIYRDTRLRLTDLVRENELAASATVPASPAWNVKDVVAHLAGVCADILAGNIAGLASDPWTAAQVEARRGSSLDDVLEEWSTLAPQVEALTPMFPGDSAAQWVADLSTHEQDVRGALEKPGARDDVSLEVAVHFMGRAFIDTARDAGFRGLRIQVEGHDWRTDEEAPEATLVAEPFEFARSVTGRRSLDQIRRLDWQGDPEPYLKAFEWGPFRPTSKDIIEP